MLLTPPLFAQKVIGDTTDLKTYNGSGVVILEQYGGNVWDMTGGGLFHYADSSLTEGTDAFDHPISGKQWVRVGSTTSPFQNISATTVDMAGNIILENDEIIDNSTDGDITFIFNDDAAILGQVYIQSSIDTPNVADNDHLDLFFQANDDSSGMTSYGSIIVTATDVSDESEDSRMEIKTFKAGTETTSLRIQGGIDWALFSLHTKVVGDSALGRMFLDAADTTLKMGSGSDLIIIKDLIP